MKSVPFLWALPFCLVLTLGGLLSESLPSTSNPNTLNPRPLRRSVQFLRRVNPTSANITRSTIASSSSLVNPTLSTSSSSAATTFLPASSTTTASRVKRGHGGHGRSYSTGIAYSRVADSGPRRGPPGNGHGGRHDSKSPVGEDQTNTDDFKSYGVGYEHRHSDHCEESKCGYNIRHCPHGCVFNSFTCEGGAQYDTCCC